MTRDSSGRIAQGFKTRLTGLAAGLAVLAAVLARSGQLKSVPLAFASCLAGVLLGDLVVYFLGFFYGDDPDPVGHHGLGGANRPAPAGRHGAERLAAAAADLVVEGEPASATGKLS